MGAWIEILYRSLSSLKLPQSHPLWVRGLKLLSALGFTQTLGTSHPLWVRGLKYFGVDKEW